MHQKEKNTRVGGSKASEGESNIALDVGGEDRTSCRTEVTQNEGEVDKRRGKKKKKSTPPKPTAVRATALTNHRAVWVPGHKKNENKPPKSVGKYEK